MKQDTIQILCTRPLPDWLIEEAGAAGISIETDSFIETEPVQSTEIQQEIENAMLQSAVVVFTSMNAVEAVAGELDGHQPDWNIYTIGTTTKNLVKKYFGEERIAGFAADASSLAEIIVEERLADEVIFFCGDQRRDELPGILKDGDIEVNEIVVYQTVEVAHTVNKDYFGILFFSPSAVRSFFKLNTPGKATVLFAIGNTTAAEIKKFSSNKIITSDEPGKENLVTKMIEYFGGM